jgi:hypothetical protein
VRGCNELSGHALKVLKARARRELPCINICKVEAGKEEGRAVGRGVKGGAMRADRRNKVRGGSEGG